MKHIIIIEDDIHLARLMQESMNEIENISCKLIFTNPLEFLLNPVEADIYLLDILMPEMNGIEAIKHIFCFFVFQCISCLSFNAFSKIKLVFLFTNFKRATLMSE